MFFEETTRRDLDRLSDGGLPDSTFFAQSARLDTRLAGLKKNKEKTKIRRGELATPP